ncbi:hypothetical protein GH733_002390 [Mirounga leonina]|nr:hypothetical protein GH733_002390 [Mirounga leonina]
MLLSYRRKENETQDSPDSSMSPKVKPPPTSGEERTVRKEDTSQGKKQKIRTVFSQTQLYVLNDQFQKQKYLSLQQMQELSNILNNNLSYKQVKTWFQNQRMKCKKWQKNHWPKESKSTVSLKIPSSFGQELLEVCPDISPALKPEINHSTSSQRWVTEMVPFSLGKVHSALLTQTQTCGG